MFYFLAPHDCIMCSAENSIICAACRDELVDERVCACHICGLPSPSYEPCAECRAKTALDALFVLGVHEGELRELVHRLKFAGARQAAADIAPVLTGLLPVMPGNARIVHVPTAYQRARARGFDQAELLASAVSAESRCPRGSVLGRHGKTRQVGAGEDARRRQAEAMFSVRRPEQVEDCPILLVDDVVTTGASMETAARLLKQAGAAQVYGLAIARRIG